jgi:hypothetical protein
VSRVSEPPKRRLQQAAPSRLEQPTIMDRTLALEHGAPYVQLAAFAIDVDRLFARDPERTVLPFGWEVFLCEAYLLGALDLSSEASCVLLEDTCLSVLAQPPEEQGYGSQLVFAVYAGLMRGVLPAALKPVFAAWRKPPSQLLAALAELWRDPQTSMQQCAGDCLQRRLEPPLAPPTRSALEAMRDRRWLKTEEG